MSVISCLKNLIKRAVTTSAVDDSKITQLAQVKYFDKVSNCELINPYGISSVPPIGSVVYLFACNGNEQNLFGMANDLVGKVKGLKPGEVVIGNPGKGTSIKFNEDGDIVIEGDVLLNGNLAVKGDVIDNISTNTATLKVLRNAYNVHTHISATPGNPTGPTDSPV